MSFSNQVKQELVALDILSDCCTHAQCYGMLLFGRDFSARAMQYTTEVPWLAAYYQKFMQETLHATVTLEKVGRVKTSATFVDKQDRLRILDLFGHESQEPTRKINWSNFTTDCCYGSFLRGLFLVCGIVASPENQYHLEFVVPYKRLCMDLMRLMEEVSLSPKYINRKGNHIIYFKDSTAIEDALGVMGATNAALELMGIKIHKDMRNRVNRKVNFETANIGRTIEAAMQQVQAIEKLEKSGKLQTLPPQLQELAKVRKENPEVSLRELTQLLRVPLSRSGVNHRLNKLITLAEELDD